MAKTRLRKCIIMRQKNIVIIKAFQKINKNNVLFECKEIVFENEETEKFSTRRNGEILTRRNFQHEGTKTQRSELEHKKKNLNTKARRHKDCLHNCFICI